MANIPAIPDINPRSLLRAVKTIKQILDIREGLKTAADRFLSKTAIIDLLKGDADFTVVNLTESGVVYFGDAGTDGTWRWQRSGSDMVFQRFESDAWVTKSTISA